MVQIKGVLLLWMGGTKKKRIAAQLSLDVKTVRRDISAAESIGLAPGGGGISDEQFGAVLHLLQRSAERPHGDGWQRWEAARDDIKRLLEQHVRLSKIRRLLQRRGIDVSYSTLHRFAVSELDFGRRAPTIPVADGKPGEEIHIDTGWMTQLEPDERGRRRRFRAWIFTPHLSRYRFVYPCFEESTESAIEACEAAWAFYGGVFAVVVPDNTKAIVHTADPLKPRIVDGFLEYAQARGFHIDPARKQHPKDKARTERAVRDVRDDCFAGEKLLDLDDARRRDACCSEKSGPVVWAMPPRTHRPFGIAWRDQDQCGNHSGQRHVTTRFAEAMTRRCSHVVSLGSRSFDRIGISAGIIPATARDNRAR